MNTEMIMQFIVNNPTIAFLALVLLAWLSFFISRHYIIRVIRHFTNDLANIWAKVFFDPKLLSQLSWLLPVMIIHSGTKMIINLPPNVSLMIQKITLTMFAILTIRAIAIFLSRFNEVYSTLDMARNRPIKGIVQVAKLLLYIVAIILISSILLDRSPWVFLSGLGAMTAILLLVFRDTILSLVAGIQLTTNNLVCVGDWIEMPQFSADGDVVDIALHAVRVQNWDRTITVIPTHKFLEHSFKNWRGMQESGGRRIKRAIHIDISTIRFLTDEEIERLSRFSLLQEYIQEKKKELQEHNQKFASDLQVNARRLTNVGTFRAYLVRYLKQHPQIHQQLTFLVRQLEPGPNGLPIEIYVFVNDTRWAIYEGAQADIFDHVLSIVSEFGLRVHQNPSGYDFRSLLENK